MADYPRAVYPGGWFHPTERDEDGNVLDYRVVNSPEEEEAAKADGYFKYGTAPEGWSAPSEFDRLKAEAEERGITVKGNWGVKKLREVLA